VQDKNSFLSPFEIEEREEFTIRNEPPEEIQFGLQEKYILV
jgi:hypothetical protein